MYILAEIHKRSAACGVPSAMTQAEIDEMVNAHNAQRLVDGGDEFPLVRTDNITLYKHCILIIGKIKIR